MKASNDNTPLQPSTDIRGRSLSFDFPSIRIGIAEYEEGPTGCTVFYFPDEAVAAVDVRGGSPSTFTTDNHNFGAGERKLDAVCFTGGSVHGLEATTGVTSALLRVHGYSTDWIPKVAGAAIYDYISRDNAIYPDKLLGRAAFESARSNVFPLGRQGAGRSAIVGKGFRNWEYAGQGGAYRAIGQTKIAAFTVVNAVGALHNREGQVVRGFVNDSGARESIQTFLTEQTQQFQPSEDQNTTLTLVVTNQKLPPVYMRHLSKQIHTSMARAIYPFHSIYDGDVLFFVSTNEVENSELDPTHLGLHAAEVLWDAALNSF